MSTAPSVIKPAMKATDAAPRAISSNYPAVFAARVAGRDKRPLGDVFGLTTFGVNLTRLRPGAISALRHAHGRQDEFIYVLEGSAVLITNAGETLVTAGMCAGFKAGTGDAHHLANRGVADVLYLEVGDRGPGDSVEYPDDDLAAVFVDGRWRYQHKDGRPY